MTNLPPDIQKKIDERAKCAIDNFNYVLNRQDAKEMMADAAAFGYSLALEEIDRWKRLYEKAMEFKKGAEELAFKNSVAAKTLQSEKDMNAILTEEIERLRYEIELLRAKLAKQTPE